MSHQVYHPEMHEQQPAGTQIEASLSHYGKHWFLRTPLVLQGRGITFLKTLTSESLTPLGQRYVGWHQYKVTEKAFEAICDKYNVATEALLS